MEMLCLLALCVKSEVPSVMENAVILLLAKIHYTDHLSECRYSTQQAGVALKEMFVLNEQMLLQM